ncbi:MAG: hypothetical protein FWE30_01025 [Bacteroidales bacterium]|nr:hypothetical protein [Bacteroidales bacterium]
MKKITLLTLTLFLSAATLLGQRNTLSPDSLQLQRIIEIPNTPADTLHRMALRWLESKDFIAEQNTIEMLSETNSEVKYKYAIDYRFKRIWYRATQTITVEVKDELVRITIDNPKSIYRQYLNDKRRENNWKEFKKYDRDLQYVRNNWRSNVESLRQWIFVNYRLSERNANW